MIRLLIAAVLAAVCATAAAERAPNHLLGSESPYLLQHLYNPVDWYPWGPEALEKARTENKLIFVSVGYSACHWCHVMEAESFENEAIAAFLNAHFVSIKIDRERRPDLDEQFMFVTQLLTGGGGWPNSVFLTPDGDPFYAGTYFPPETFQRVAFQVRQAWIEDPDLVATEAARLTAAVAAYTGRRAAAREITPALAQLAIDSILEKMDPFNGGYGVAPKFPREPLFLLLLDHAERTGDRRLVGAVEEMLDGMILGGIHDHVGGGFHRYAIDPEWHVPHFEKMLYTQALTGRLLVRAWSITGAPRYRRAAERLFAYVLRDLQDPGGGFYSAQDADSETSEGERSEGAFYTWAASELAPLAAESAFAADVFQITPDGEFEGRNVLNLRASSAVLATEYGVDMTTFDGRLDRLLHRMRVLRADRPAPFLDRKILVSWNAMMIATLAEAAYRLQRPEYFAAAEAAVRLILEKMQAPEGMQRVFFDGSAGVAAQLPDYAGLGLAFVALHDYAPEPAARDAWLSHARHMADEIRRRFGAADEGYGMTQRSDGLTRIVQVDDTEIPSGNAMALALFARLAARSQAPDLEQDSVRLAAALSGSAIGIPDQRSFALKAIQELQRGETGRVRYAAAGAVRAHLTHDPTSGAITVALSVAEGWHINAHEPLEDYFIATELSLDPSAELAVAYPEPVEKTLSFNDAPLALYEGDIRLSARLPARAPPDPAAILALTLQACSDEICLQPEELRFALWE